MTRFEELMLKHEENISLCQKALKKKDNLKAQFYKKCAEGFKIKAERLTLKEASHGSCN